MLHMYVSFGVSMCNLRTFIVQLEVSNVKQITPQTLKTSEDHWPNIEILWNKMRNASLEQKNLNCKTVQITMGLGQWSCVEQSVSAGIVSRQLPQFRTKLALYHSKSHLGQCFGLQMYCRLWQGKDGNACPIISKWCSAAYLFPASECQSLRTLATIQIRTLKQNGTLRLAGVFRKGAGRQTHQSSSSTSTLVSEEQRLLMV